MSALISTLSLFVLAAPEITEVTPQPLPLAATVEVVGSGYVDQATSVKIGDVAQQVILIQSDRLRFLVALDTPLGPQTLTLTTQGQEGGVTDVAVEVVPPVPQIQTVEPEVLTLGSLATVIGDGLATVTAVMLDDLPCAVSEQTDAVIAFEIPFDAELLGVVTLELVSPSGRVREDVVVSAPRPEIDALVPNPVPAGGLVTVRGHIAAIQPKVTIAAVEVPIVSVADGPSDLTEITVWVPSTMTPKPYDVVVTSGSESSPPAGPLIIEAASPDAPEVGGVYPMRVAAGGDVWVAGTNLDLIEEAIGGFALIECARRGCRLSTEELDLGMRYGAVVGPDGAGVVQVEVLDEEPVVPVIASVEPSPAIRGEPLLIRGERLAAVRSVVLGGVAQSIAFVDADVIEITINETTPLGAEPLFVSGNTGSEALAVTVLDPLPAAESGPETNEGAEVVVAEGDHVEAETPGGGGGGCGGGPGGGLVFAVVALLVWFGRRSSRMAGLKK